MKALLAIGITAGFGLICGWAQIERGDYGQRWEIYKAKCVAEHGEYYCDRTIGVTEAGPSIIVVPRR